MGVNHQRRFEGKSDLAIWGGVNRQRRFEGKSYRRFEGKSDLAISGGGKSSNIFHQVNTFHLLS